MRAEATLGDPGETAGEPTQDPLVGRVLAGKYLLQALIAKGGMGRIFRAEQQPIGRPVAIKLLSMDSVNARDPNFEQRFSLEAATLGRLRHPNTITMFDYGTLPDEGACYIAMELVEGENLSRVVKREGPLAPGRAVRIIYEVARALVEAHDLGIVHRDIKPANIMITRSDEGEGIKVLDFGIAKVRSGVDQELTAAHTLMGSPKFMSPEQIRNEGVDPRSDIYSLGVVLFYLMTGREPFRGSTPVETMVAHLNQPVPALRELGVDVPPSVEAVVRRCLEKRQADRYQSSVELKIALRRALVALDQTVTGPTPTLSRHDLPEEALAPVRPSARPVSGGTARYVAAGVAVLLLLLGGAAAALALRADPEPPPPVVAAPAPEPAAPPEPVAAPAAPPAPAAIRVMLTSEPTGAEVVERGEVLGRTPLSIEWAPKPTDLPREFEYRLAGHQPARVTWFPAGTDQAQHVVLRPAAPAPARPAPRPAPPKPKPQGDDLLLER